MSSTTIAQRVPHTGSAETGHKLRLAAAYVVAISIIIGLAAYGANYYLLDAAQRPYSPKHALLKPSGMIGIKLGMIGLSMFLVIFLYPLRKRW